MTAISGLSFVQASDLATAKASDIFAVAAELFNEANFQVQEPDLLVCAYEPPPDIGGPKRTGGSGGRYT